MALSRLAILAIRGSKGGVQKLAEVLNVSRQSVYRYLDNNDDNLTKASCLEVIRSMTGLSDDQILEKEAERQN